MINKITVFVLGAGANVPYGFSTGAGLVDKVRGRDPQKLMGDAGQQVTKRQADAFSEAVVDSLLPSIDALLEHRKDLAAVGKRVIATLLYKEEAKAGARSSAEDWISLLFDNMARNADSLEVFAQNPVSFVTFNYDRYLEHRFIRGLVSRYKVNDHDAWAKIKGMFVHVYGHLGSLPSQTPVGQPHILAIPLGAPDLPGFYTLGVALPEVEKTISIVHDDAKSNTAFAEVIKRFQSAEQVFFLGFGFGDKNVQRLELHRIPQSAAIYCTSFGMTTAEIRVLIEGAFPHRTVTTRPRPTAGSEPIQEYLREFIQCFR